MYAAPSDVEAAVQSALGTFSLHLLSTDELKQLLNNDEQLDSKVQDLAAIQSLRSTRDVTVGSNKSLAEYNLAQQPRIMELKSKVRQLLEETDALQQEIKDKRDKLSVVDQPLDTTLALLQTAAAEAEEESENLVQSMLNGEMSLDNFLELYLPKRRVAIARRVKTDKLKELVRSQGGGGGGGGYQLPASSGPPPVATPYPPAPAAPSPYGAATPYPGVPYPPAGGYQPAGPALPYPYMPGGMPLPRY
ncbi:vacuolar protein sorting-associated protein 37B-like [Pollicipes pollicipes]|uniref:vacuolar protein sorting-associated protein 37B-like n=1 Tax=Pollicipes pollicipes TaxID=41117 RepID=UPI0018856705|nr:vacuolar protein sorting-associated protein 37B-like [Pollicipes pollicipes]XP_037092557.1 vacuolar protein sorting-associated protein 37B-like [Pollicipes pollicipes]